MSDDVAFFWSKVTKGDGCWEWQASRNKQGYGHITLPRGRRGRSHRVSWELHNGPIPAGYMVCHRCDNPPCVNPAHLFLGTAQDNVTDKIKKGRQKDGERHPSARLTLEQARSVIVEFRAGAAPRDLARKYGVCGRSICDLITGKTWRSRIPREDTVPTLKPERAKCRLCGGRAHARELCNKHYLQATRKPPALSGADDA